MLHSLRCGKRVLLVRHVQRIGECCSFRLQACYRSVPTSVYCSCVICNASDMCAYIVMLSDACISLVRHLLMRQSQRTGFGVVRK